MFAFLRVFSILIESLLGVLRFNSWLAVICCILAFFCSGCMFAYISLFCALFWFCFADRLHGVCPAFSAFLHWSSLLLSAYLHISAFSVCIFLSCFSDKLHVVFLFFLLFFITHLCISLSNSFFFVPWHPLTKIETQLAFLHGSFGTCRSEEHTSELQSR